PHLLRDRLHRLQKAAQVVGRSVPGKHEALRLNRLDCAAAVELRLRTHCTLFRVTAADQRNAGVTAGAGKIIRL
ncbi:MAG TPA: hypothetical protein VGC15_23460, partial [Acetobacteraceae bacterium]